MSLGEDQEVIAIYERVIRRAEYMQQHETDYGRLLAQGHVVRSLSDVDAQEWRADIRRQARQDRMPVRTWAGKDICAAWLRDPDRAIDRGLSDAQAGELMKISMSGQHDLETVMALDTVALRCARCERIGVLLENGSKLGQLFVGGCEAPE